jgi:hypothetical protein
MNEQIKELYNEACEDLDLTDDILQKFAELIVRECIRKIEDIAESSNNPQPIYRVAVDLLEHFGVEQ